MRYIISLLLTSTAALAEVPLVVTDIPPIHALTAAVMGDLGPPVLLLAKGASEHSFQLRPSQAASLADADLVVWIGPELTPWLDGALALRPAGAATLGLLAAEGTYRQEYETGGQDHATDTDHDHAGVDPHAWLDPDNGMYWLDLIADELSRLDPEHAATYDANAEAAKGDIAQADAEARAVLDPVRDRPFVTFHQAYGYFSAHYGLTPAGTIATGDATAPGAQHLSELQATMKAGAHLCIFPELQHDPALVAQMADGTGATIGGALDPVGSGTTPGPHAYGELLTSLARTIADCTGG